MALFWNLSGSADLEQRAADCQRLTAGHPIQRTIPRPAKPGPWLAWLPRFFIRVSDSCDSPNFKSNEIRESCWAAQDSKPLRRETR